MQAQVAIDIQERIAFGSEHTTSQEIVWENHTNWETILSANDVSCAEFYALHSCDLYENDFLAGPAELVSMPGKDQPSK